MKKFAIGSRLFTVEDIHAITRENFGDNEFKTKEIKDELLQFVEGNMDCMKEIDRAVYYSIVDKRVQGVIKVKRGTYRLGTVTPVEVTSTSTTVDNKPHTIQKMEAPTMSLVPMAAYDYVPHGCYNVVRKVISKNIFAPIWVAGLSGNGKTLGVEQACAKEGRELITINISNETSEEDLIGSYVLDNGNMVWQDGPVLTAMRLGSVLLLDEIDQARASIMCLNTIAQGKPYYVKKTNELVTPKEGFTIIGTANTKGDGSGMDKFTGAQIMNEAFLERFAIIVEQEYPTKAVEKRILMKHTASEKFVETLIDIAQAIRSSFDSGDIDIMLTTRRLVQIVKNYEIFEDEVEAIKYAIARFSSTDQQIIMEVYNALTSDDGE